MNTRNELALSIIDFLKSEKESGRLGEDGTEALEVAIDCLQNAYGLQDSNTSSLNLLDICDVALNNSPKTKPVTDDHKKQAEDLKSQGNDLMKQEQYLEAITCYTKAIDLNPSNAVYYCNRAAAHTKLNENEKAIVDCEKALSIDANYSKAYGRMGLVYLNGKKYEKSIRCYEKAVHLEPSNNSYKQNLELAREQMKSEQPSVAATPTAANPLAGLDLGSLLSNPAVMNMAQSFMQNPQMQNMFSSMMGGPPPSQPPQENTGEEATANPQPEGVGTGFQMPAGLDLGNIMNATQQFAEQMRQTNPDLVNNLRSQFQQGQHPTETPPTKEDDPPPSGGGN